MKSYLCNRHARNDEKKFRLKNDKNKQQKKKLNKRDKKKAFDGFINCVDSQTNITTVDTFIKTHKRNYGI